MSAPRPGDEPTEPSGSVPPPRDPIYLGPTSHGDGGDFRSADPNGVTQPGEPPLPPATRFLPEIPGFDLLDEVGRGGMGVVYKAIQHRLQRVVALKMVLAGVLASHETTLRFLAESEAIARLTHPNVVQIHGTGDLAGVPYFVMEFVGGGSLSSRLDGTPWDPRDAARLIETLALAVAEVHRLGIVHRDLKPGNILFTPLGVPKLVDFGLVKWLNLSSELTQTESVMGSPSYMAPEQARGDKKEIGKTTDVYSLGAILYELLTGRPPFKATSVLETLEQVKALEPVRPSRFQPKIPRDLETITLKCLEKDPARRYATAEALAADLENWRDGRPLTARPVGPPARLWRWCRRNPSLAISSTIALLALVSLALLSSVAALALARGTARLRDEQRRTAVALETAGSQRDKAERLAAAQSLGRGVLMSEMGDADRGMLWMVRALELLDGVPHHAAIPFAVRSNLDAWRHRLNPLAAFHAVTATFTDVNFDPSGTAIVTYGRNRHATVIAADSGRPVGSALEHPGAVLAAVIAADGHTVLTGCEDGKVRLWDARGDGLVRELPASESPVISVAITPDARTAISGSADGTVRLWRFEAGTDQTINAAGGESVCAVALSDDGALAILGSTRGAVWVCRLSDGQVLSERPDSAADAPVSDVRFALDGQAALAVWADGSARWISPNETRAGGFDLGHGGEEAPQRLHNVGAISPDSRLAITAGWDGTAQVWSLDDGSRMLRPLVHQGPIRAVACSRDGRYALTGSMDKTARVWDLRDGSPIGPPLEHRGAVTAVAFSDDGTAALTVSDGGTLQRWNLAGEHAIRPPLSAAGPIYRVAVSPNGSRVVTASEDGTAQLWRAADGAPVGQPLAHNAAVWDVAFSPDGKLVLTGSEDGTARLWNVADGSPASPPLVHLGRVWAVAFRPDGRLVATASADGTARLWSVPDGHPAGPELRHDGPVLAVRFSPDGGTLVTGSQDGTARQWRADNGAAIRTLVQGRWPIESLAVSGDGSRIAVGDRSGTIRLVDARDGKAIGAGFQHQTAVNALLFSPDGHTLLSASSDRTARLWDIQSGLALGAPLEHRGTVFAIAFSPDGKLVVTGSHDNTARLWSASDGLPIGPPLRHYGWVWSVAFTPDGHRVVTGSGDHTARFWPVPRPMPGTIEEIDLWVQTVTGLQLDSSESVHVLDPTSWDAQRQRLQALDETP